MTLPPAIRQAVEATLEERSGRPVRVREAAPVGGGCISPTGRIETDAGERFFLKWSDDDLPRGLLGAEADGLRQLAAADAVRVPEVIHVAEGRPEWLLLEWLEPGTPTAEAWERLGAEVARLHRNRTDRFGADASNFIGSLPQDNAPTDDWAEFWWDRRLRPQLGSALEAGLMTDGDRARFHHLRDRLPGLLLDAAAADGASLLHGDLWNGNVHVLTDGTPALIDPSVYHGHREVDLAMTELFGGFGRGFRAAYEDEWPLAPGYPVRRAVYQLYYLLVHVNLFGRSYLGRTRQTLEAAGA